SAKSLDANGIAHLKEAVDAILAIRQIAPERQWIRALREIGYGVYLVKYADIQERARQKREKGITADGD
ncbi:MAG: hypothetical protein QXI12_12835, partial [Candidatus Methanomethyliaceae archaeon]